MATTGSIKRKFNSICTITIFVGSERTRFEVHQNHLCEVSSFFKAAFTSQYKESSEKVIDLLEDEVDIVEQFVQWLYTDRCDLWSVPIDNEDHYLMQSMKLLVFADKYDIPTFKEYLIRKLLAHAMSKGASTPSEAVVVWAYSNTGRGSGIRRMIAEWYATWNTEMWFEAQPTEYWLLKHPEIAVDLVAALSKIAARDYIPESFRENDEGP